VINGLLGAGVTVNLIGHNTCGKPYGFYPQDNCGTSYFAIEFEGVNAQNFGDYADGFVPGGGGQAGPPGCQVADDFTHDLGDPAEARLQAALQFKASGSCPAPSLRGESAVSQEDAFIVRSPALENRILWRPSR
jgi:carboxyl-terminal processing protease